jgi:hypothetical protein
MEVSGQLHVLATLPRGKGPPLTSRYPLAPEPVWTRWQRESKPTPAGNRIEVIQPKGQSLYWPSYRGSYVAWYDYEWSVGNDVEGEVIFCLKVLTNFFLGFIMTMIQLQKYRGWKHSIILEDDHE